MVLETAVIRLRAGGTLCDLPAVSCPFHPGVGVAAATAVAVSSSCGDDSSVPVVVATESVGGLSFLRVQYLTVGQDFCSVKLGLGSWQC